MYPICNVGHADLVELPDGSWYMVMLASRLMDGYHKDPGPGDIYCPGDMGGRLAGSMPGRRKGFMDLSPAGVPGAVASRRPDCRWRHGKILTEEGLALSGTRSEIREMSHSIRSRIAA